MSSTDRRDYAKAAIIAGGKLVEHLSKVGWRMHEIAAVCLIASRAADAIVQTNPDAERVQWFNDLMRELDAATVGTERIGQRADAYGEA